MGVISVSVINVAIVEAKTLTYKVDANKMGAKSLSDGDYPGALKHFNTAAKECPDSCEAHFGRASALSRLGRGEEAAKEFKLALLLNPSPELKKRLEAELTVLQGDNSRPATAVAPPAATAPPPSAGAADAERSISKILSQSEERINHIHSTSEKYATNLYGNRVSAQQKMLEQAKQEADAMRRAVGSRRGISPFVLADINQYEAELRRKADFFLGRARGDYDSRRKEAQTRARGIKDSADGLERQMLTRPSETSGVFLMPTGTNLYVRNYGHFDPVMPERQPLVPLSAVPLKLPEVVKMEQEQSKKSKKVRDHEKTFSKAKASSRGD